MSRRYLEMAYRTTALEGADGVGLIIALYDTLAGDLRRAIEAMRAGDTEKRCKEINHAMLVLGYLEQFIDRQQSAEYVQSLTMFYGYLRAKMLEAQVKKSTEMLGGLVELVLSVRGTWQQFESRTSAPAPAVEPPVMAAQSPFAFQEEFATSSWSA